MSEIAKDPVHRARHSFRPDGENLVVDTWIEPGGGLPPHMHPHQEERWSVVEGEIRLQLGREKRVIGPEDGEMLVPPGTRHALSSCSDTTAHLRCYAAPAMNLQGFLEESAAAAQEGLFMKGGIPRNLRGLRWAAGFLARYRDDVVLAFPPQPVQRALIALASR